MPSRAENGWVIEYKGYRVSTGKEAMNFMSETWRGGARRRETLG